MIGSDTLSIEAAGKHAAVQAMSRLWRSALAQDLVSMLVLLVAALILFQEGLFQGKVFYEYDTPGYYFPMAARVDQTLDTGSLPTWSPYLFGGFPLFADGETSMLSPLTLLALIALPLGQAFIFSYFLRFFLAGAFMYSFARAIRLDRPASLAAGLIFAGGSFMVGQMHHLNMTGAALWLPLILRFVEKAYTTRGRARYTYLLFSSVAVAMQSLTFHVNPIFMTGSTVAAYVLFRAFIAPDAPRQAGEPAPAADQQIKTAAVSETAAVLGGKRDLGDGLRFVALTIAIVPATSAALAAVQLLPTLELGTLSIRASGGTWESASSYSIAPVNLITMFLPYFFRAVPGYSGMLWAFWETTLYVGIATLILAPLAVFFRRCRFSLFFAALAILSLLLAFGSYSPIDLYWYLWQLPGISSMRVPGRFAMLFVFSCAMLAALGLNWLTSVLRSRQSGTTARASVRVRWWLAACAGFGVILLVTFTAARWYMLAYPDNALALLKSYYLSMRTNTALWPEGVMRSIVRALDVSNPTTAWSFIIFFSSLSLVALWLRFRQLGRLWSAGIVLVLTMDLLVFATYFHPSRNVRDFALPSGAIQFLKQQTGLTRVYATWPNSAIEPNGLLQFQIPTAGGYSSLQTELNRNYTRFADYRGGLFLDLWNVRYRVVKNRPSALWTRDDVAYDSLRPMISGEAGNRNSQISLAVPEGDIDELRVVSAIRNGQRVQQGNTVGEITLTDADGLRTSLPLRAGIETADLAYDRPYAGPFHHFRPQSAFSLRQWSPHGSQASSTLYTARIALPTATSVDRIYLSGVDAEASLEVYGLAVRDAATGQLSQLLVRRDEKLVYQDQDVLIYERSSYMPRAFVTPRAKIVDSDAEALSYMAEAPFDPWQTVVLIHKPDDSLAAVPIQDGASPRYVSVNPVASVAADARITAYMPEEVSVQTSAESGAYLVLTDSFYPGWRAFIDGRETQIYRADYLFRAVRIPPGQHNVVFVYDSTLIKVGKWISAISGSALLLFLLVSLGARIRPGANS
ncbi:MAG: hypothetical protein EPO21_09005 [Chloroflexota bacterium]|nr:MAG: hypothetical protein EPO21_09005 [Chloroflexota bacterium]